MLFAIRSLPSSPTLGIRKQGHSEFPDISGGLAGAEVTEGAGTREAWPRKLTESAREFPKAFHLAEPVMVAPEGPGETGLLHH